ncbi:MAG TPA: hypothetical protein VHO03_04780 [Ignavibacteriales bacterium]|nr:hypothetical protein [Ignavibacteriales bacterium]
MPERFFISESGKGKTAAENQGKKFDFDLIGNETHNSLPECFVNELKMLKSVKFTLCTNTDIVQTLPKFVQALDTFEDYLNKISRMYTDTKARLIQFTCRLASAVNTYGVMIDNDELITASLVKEDDLENQTDEVLFNRSSRILEDARKYLQAPNPFGIYQEIFSECEAVMNDFGYAVDMPQSHKKGNNSWKEEHDRLFINAHEFLNTTLDSLVDSLKGKYPGFYREYRKSRTVEKPAKDKPQADRKAEESSYEIPY